MLRIRAASLLLLAGIAWCIRTALANRGSIPFLPRVRIFEPKQRALIAWNGEEELLILSTDVHASAPSQVLEVLPLPSEPRVEEASLLIFHRVVRLILAKLSQGAWFRGGIRGVAHEAGEPAGEVTFHEPIGPHDISIIRLLHRDGFLEWVENYLSSAGVKNPRIPQKMADIVQRYITEGFVWFVFDVVSVDQIPKTNAPIQYKFKTPRLFYPMRISSLGAGRTSVELFVFTQRTLTNFLGIPSDRIRPWESKVVSPIALTTEEVMQVGEEVARLFARYESMSHRRSEEASRFIDAWLVQPRYGNVAHRCSH